MNDEKFWTRWSEIHEQLDKERKQDAKKPKEVDPWQQLYFEIDQLVPMMIGLQTSPKLGSQQQMKVRRACDKFANDMLVLTDPDVNKRLANEIYYNGLKQRMVDKVKTNESS